MCLLFVLGGGDCLLRAFECFEKRVRTAAQSTCSQQDHLTALEEQVVKGLEDQLNGSGDAQSAMSKV